MAHLIGYTILIILLVHYAEFVELKEITPKTDSDIWIISRGIAVALYGTFINSLLDNVFASYIQVACRLITCLVFILSLKALLRSRRYVLRLLRKALLGE